MAGLTEEYEKKYIDILKLDKSNEDMVIGYIIDDEGAALTAIKLIKPISFIYSFNTHIFKILKSHLEKGKNLSDVHATIASITDEDWKKISEDSKTNKEDHITQCRLKALNLLGNSTGAEGLFKKINEQYSRRLLFDHLNKFRYSILNTNGLNDIASTVGEFIKNSNSLLDLMAMDGKEEFYTELVRKILDKKEKESINTGYKMLDNLIDGFKGGELVTIAAGTGVGKSAFVVNIALNMIDLGYNVALWSFEMSQDEVVERILSNVTCISKRNAEAREERYNRARKYIDAAPDFMHIFTDGIKDMNNFYLICRKLKNQKDLKIVIIDYLQLVRLSGFFSYNRHTEIEYITNTLKSIASELDITIIILSQLSREHQKRNDKTPILSDLRDSGSIEQDSNIVMFLHVPDEQPSHYRKTEKSVKVIVAKNRSGRCGSFFMKYTGYLTKFEEIEDNAIVA